MDTPKPTIREEEEEEEECVNNSAGQYAMQLASAAILPMALKAAIEIGLFDTIHKAGANARLPASDIASRTPLSGHSMLDRLLRLLTSYSILTSTTNAASGHRSYGLAPVARYFVRDSVSLVPLFQMIHDKVMMETWQHLKDALLQGGVPFESAYGVSASEYVARDPRFAGVFRDSMVDYNVLFMEKILVDYEGFNDVTSIVDVGGGNGLILNMIVSKYPSIEGVNLDLPSVIERSPSYSGIENVAGDMFAIIPKGDAVFLKWILHNLDDQQCLKVLKNCHDALPENGKLMIVEMAVPEEATPASISILQFDVFLSSINHGGKERTAKEFQVLAIEAGFSSIKVAIQAYNFSLLEFRKN